MARSGLELYLSGVFTSFTRWLTKHIMKGMPNSKPRVIPPLPGWPRKEAAILVEVTDAAVAAELWVQLRHVRDWLQAAQEGAQDLFHEHPSSKILARRAEALEAAHGLENALPAFHALTDGLADCTSERLAIACVAVADWANEAGFGTTAAQFAAASTRADPQSPVCHNVAGLTHRKEGEWSSAELYYLRAAYLAREQNNVDERVSAHIGLAALWLSRGHPRRARRHLDTATNAATRSGSLWLAGHAQHDLMLMLTECGDYGQAERAASRAVGLYPLNDPRFPYLAADFAFLQIAQHRYAESIPLLERFLELVTEPAQQVIGLSLKARAYAGAGRVDELDRVRAHVISLVAVHTQDRPAAFYHLAEAARSCGRWQAAEEFASLAHEEARQRGDISVALHSAALLSKIAARKYPEASAAPDSTTTRRTTANALFVRLARWNPGARKGRKRTRRRNHWAA
jgi:tetratricopeptide (TPR) repeat protein